MSDHRDPEISKLLHAIRELIAAIKNKMFHLWTVTIGPDEPIKNKIMAQIKLTKVLAPGFRRALLITPDEPVDARPDGSFCQATPTVGDSTGTVDPSSTATAIKAFVNGDGSLGEKVVTFAVDGHVGEGDAEITMDVAFTVGTPDATELKVVEAGTPDERIPTP